jgi:hypothetical protein
MTSGGFLKSRGPVDGPEPGLATGWLLVGALVLVAALIATGVQWP